MGGQVVPKGGMLRGLVVLLALSAALAGGDGRRPPSLWTTADHRDSSLLTLRIIALYWTPLQYGAKAVSGRLINESRTTIDTAYVAVEFFDASGVSVCSVTSRVVRVRPHEEREFCTWLVPKRCHRFELRSVLGRSNAQ